MRNKKERTKKVKRVVPEPKAFVEPKKKKNVKVSKVVIRCAFVLAIFYLLSIIIINFDNSVPGTTFYQVQSDQVSSNFRIVQLSDLHLEEFGKNNSILVNKVKKLNPDIIALTGDMTDDEDPNYNVVLTLCKQLVNIADVYYCYGNNEASLIHATKNSTFKEDLRATGVKTLGNGYELVKKGETTIALGGVSGSKDSFYGDKFLKQFEKLEYYKVLLCHRPELYYDKLADKYQVDLVLSGHTHGGQWILPYFGGIYAPDQGILPKYDYGEFDINSSKLIISRGLGSGAQIPRFNNIPEITVTDINWY